MKPSTARRVVLGALTFMAIEVCWFGRSSSDFAEFLLFVGLVVIYTAHRSVDPASRRPHVARWQFLHRHHKNVKGIDTNELIVGTGAFQINDHVSFADSLSAFDNDAFARNFSTIFNDSRFSFIDHVHGGTDSTGMGGMGGHNDQGWGTDSPSSMSHSSFNSSSHDPFA